MGTTFLDDPGLVRRAAIRLANLAGRGLSRFRVRGIPRLMSLTGPVLVGRGVRLVRTANGRKLCIDGDDYFACMMFYGRFGTDLIALLDALVRPSDRVLDVGAQLGYVTGHLAALVGPTGHVHSFEPDPNALARLRRGVAANGHQHVTVMPMAASDRDGELVLHVSPVVGWSTAVTGTHLGALVPVTVRAARLDTLRDEGALEGPIRLVKIDVEGFEASVLDGMQRLLAEDRPYVVLEVNPELLAPAGHRPADVFERLVRHGYLLHRLEEPGGLLGGGQVRLVPLDAASEVGFCDVLASPAERPPPAHLLGASP